MSRIVNTKLGRFNQVTDGVNKWWLWECARCHQEWLPLSTEQMDGTASVVHDYHYGDPEHGRYCGYHETHEYGKELVTNIQTKAFFGEPIFEPEAAAGYA